MAKLGPTIIDGGLTIINGEILIKNGTVKVIDATSGEKANYSKIRIGAPLNPQDGDMWLE
jgi:gluconate kinase